MVSNNCYIKKNCFNGTSTLEDNESTSDTLFLLGTLALKTTARNEPQLPGHHTNEEVVKMHPSYKDPLPLSFLTI